jgi:hypothetical protein
MMISVELRSIVPRECRGAGLNDVGETRDCIILSDIVQRSMRWNGLKVVTTEFEGAENAVYARAQDQTAADTGG